MKARSTIAYFEDTDDDYYFFKEKLREYGDDIDLHRMSVVERLTKNYSLTLIDVFCGIHDGFEIAAEVRKKFPDMPIVMISGARENSNVDKRLGIAMFAMKPVNIYTIRTIAGFMRENNNYGD